MPSASQTNFAPLGCAPLAPIPDSPSPVSSDVRALSGGRAWHSPWGCCAHKPAQREMWDVVEGFVWLCARVSSHGSDVCTRVIGCVVRCALFRRLRWQSTGNSGQGPASRCVTVPCWLRVGGRSSAAVGCAASPCGARRAVRSCRAVVPCPITARPVCSGAVDLAQWGPAVPLCVFVCGLPPVWCVACGAIVSVRSCAVRPRRVVPCGRTVRYHRTSRVC